MSTLLRLSHDRKKNKFMSMDWMDKKEFEDLYFSYRLNLIRKLNYDRYLILS